jgi:hypothetical protein
MTYVASVDYCKQVGVDKWQMFESFKILNGGESITDVMNWAKKTTGDSNVRLKIATAE